MFSTSVRMSHNRSFIEKRSITPKSDADVWVEIDLNPEKIQNEKPKKETTRLIFAKDSKIKKIFGKKSGKNQEEIEPPSSPKIPCSAFVRRFMQRRGA